MCFLRAIYQGPNCWPGVWYAVKTARQSAREIKYSKICLSQLSNKYLHFLYSFLLLLESGSKVDGGQNNKSTFVQTTLWHFRHHLTPSRKYNSDLFKRFPQNKFNLGLGCHSFTKEAFCGFVVESSSHTTESSSVSRHPCCIANLQCNVLKCAFLSEFSFVVMFVLVWISFVALLCYELWCLKTVSLARLSD